MLDGFGHRGKESICYSSGVILMPITKTSFWKFFFFFVVRQMTDLNALDNNPHSNYFLILKPEICMKYTKCI